MSTTFTPGPWFVADWDNDFGEDLYDIEARESEVLHPGQSSIWPGGIAKSRVASTNESSFDRETNLANTRLIAAAPDLLAALVMVRDADEDCKRDGLKTIPAAARATIDAAIKLATKEAQS